MSMQVLTANRLRDGRVVYLTPDGGWSLRLGDALTAAGDSAAGVLAAQGRQAVAARLVVDPYLIAVADGGGAIRPLRFREAIRAEGPTVPSEGAR